jgi:hypothetical protein
MDDLATHHFTTHRDAAIDAAIREDVTWLRDEILGAFPDAAALFLVGGFGRGEGGVVQREGRWRPVNDYDFELITVKPADEKELKQLGERCSRELKIPFVHVDNSVVWKQRVRRPSEYTVDLKFASLALHDPQDMRAKMTRVVPEQIPLMDGLMTLFTRTSALLWLFDADKDWNATAADERLDLANQIAKALLAVESAALIRAHRYCPDHGERLVRFETLKPTQTHVEQMWWATAMKLRPDLTAVPDDLRAAWFRARDLHRAEVFRHASAMAGRPIGEERGLETWLLGESLSVWESLRLMQPGRRAAWERRMRLAVAQVEALGTLSDDGSADEEAIGRLAGICEELGEGVRLKSWEGVRRTLNSVFGKIW